MKITLILLSWRINLVLVYNSVLVYFYGNCEHFSRFLGKSQNIFFVAFTKSKKVTFLTFSSRHLPIQSQQYGNTGTIRGEICSKFTIRTLERPYWLWTSECLRSSRTDLLITITAWSVKTYRKRNWFRCKSLLPVNGKLFNPQKTLLFVLEILKIFMSLNDNNTNFLF